MITLGPILGYEWDRNSDLSYYTVIIRTDAKAPLWQVDGQSLPMTALTPVLGDGTKVWRGEIQISPFSKSKDTRVEYQIRAGSSAQKNILGDSSWEFVVPGIATPSKQPEIAFCSCNGFSDPKAAKGLPEPLALWSRMESHHHSNPLHLLIMGGDQLYCDDLAREPNLPFREWLWMSPEQQKTRLVTTAEKKALREAYLDHYLSCWVSLPDKSFIFEPMIRVMASVPSVMIWDDHDIYDGYGSYENGGKETPFFKAVYEAAAGAFELYQLRGWKAYRSKLTNNAKHYSWGVKFGHYTILAMDNRSGRTPLKIMPDEQWGDIVGWLQGRKAATTPDGETLLVVSPVPVVYRRFKDGLTSLPGQQEMEDDLVDHWNDRRHEGERDKLVHHLFQCFRDPVPGGAGFHRITILSGDVHVGGLGFLTRDDRSREIAQIVASGIVHPSPGWFGWKAVQAMSNTDDYSIKGQDITASLVRAYGAEDINFVTRNFARLKLGDDGRLWVNWECEDTKYPKPYFGLK